MRARIQDLVARKQTLLEKQVTGKSEVTALAADAGERLNSWNREYKEALGVRSIEQFQSEYFYKLPSNKRKYKMCIRDSFWIVFLCTQSDSLCCSI